MLSPSSSLYFPSCLHGGETTYLHFFYFLLFLFIYSHFFLLMLLKWDSQVYFIIYLLESHRSVLESNYLHSACHESMQKYDLVESVLRTFSGRKECVVISDKEFHRNLAL